MQTSSNIHLNYVKRVLQYVNNTLDQGFFYKKNMPIQLEEYTNADWAGNATDLWSIFAFVISFGSWVVS